MNTIIAAFCDRAAADQAIALLQSRGVTDVQILGSDIAGTNIISTLSGFHIPDDKRQLYAEVMRRGAVVIAAHADDDAREVANDLDRMGSLDLDAASTRWRQSGWNGYDMNALPYDADACAQERSALVSESAYSDNGIEGRDLDVIEERVAVGKREVSRGGVRVRTYVAERPVQENVQLREERIDVTRERVDEPVSPGALDTTLAEDEFVVTARGEEAIVGKEARVVERVHVGKTAETRTETIEETERRRDVEVEPIEDAEIGRPHR